MDGTLVQTPDRSAMLAALERLVVAESPSPDKARCDACADEVAALFAQRTGARATRHRLLADAATTNALVLGTHFAGTSAGRVLSTPVGYRFVPEIPHR